MRAITMPVYGGPEVLQLVDLPDPAAYPNPRQGNLDADHRDDSQEMAKLSARYPIERMRAIEEKRAREREQAAIEAERAAEAEAQRYAVEVATYLDEEEATEALRMLLDAGYEGTLITREVDDRPVFTLQVGPFDDLWSADRAASLLDSAYGYSSSVTILRREEP